MSTYLAVGVVEAPVAPERKAKRPRWFWYAVIALTTSTPVAPRLR